MPVLTDAQKIIIIRLAIGDVQNNPFYPMFSDDDYTAFLTYCNGVIQRAIRIAAIGASMQLSTVNYREKVGDEDIWSNVSRDYQKALKELISEHSEYSLPDGAMPYAAGISWADMQQNNWDKDNVRPELTKINMEQHYNIYVNRRSLEWPLAIV